jgi:hypothetical protein
MFNKEKIKELEKDIAFHKKYAGIRQDKLLAVRRDVEQLTADKAELKRVNGILMGEVYRKTNLLNEMLDKNNPPLTWTKGEPSKIGWYFVACGFSDDDTRTTALFYNPAARCKWMRGEKGNAERFEGKVIAYMEVPEYEN